MDTLNELQSCPNYSPTSFDRRPMHGEYYKQNTYHSIAMSACKSRLRQKLLPPPAVQQQQQQADIYSVNSDGEEGSSRQPQTKDANANSSHQMTIESDRNQNGSPPLFIDNNNPRHSSAGGGGEAGRGSASAQRPASTDSLARQALMAAQVLHLIPTDRARARSIAQGNNVVCNNTLLGTSELNRILPNREVKIFVGTWNMNGEPQPT